METQIPIYHQLLIAEAKRRLFDESAPRILRCLEELSEAAVWERPNPQSNSAGNLVLHLCGNVRQWIVAALGNQADNRQRQQEFDEQGPIPKAELYRLLAVLEADVNTTLDQLQPGDLLRTYAVQGFSETGLSILIHVIEHFSYHTGQLAYLTKARLGTDLGFYRGHDLEAKND
ncbi:MAG: DUF1572 family protein [Lewinellaceae bacterium]|nr:DUF1572 family protein [Lewinellaceae bacterium]